MNLNHSDFETLRTMFAVCRIAGVDAVVISEGFARGLSSTGKIALLSPLTLSASETIPIGIGRIGELEKRLSIFGGEITGRCSLSADGTTVSSIKIQSGRSSVDFRCTAAKLIPFAKSNADTEDVLIRASRAEISQLARAVKSLNPETLTIALSKSGEVRIECSSDTNERFDTVLTTSAEFLTNAQNLVNIYEADRLSSLLDAAARDADEVQIVLGAGGTLTLSVKGQILVVIPNANMEDDDE